MSTVKNFDVVVIGTGITGLSTTLHLLDFGVKNIGLAGPEPNLASVSRDSAGFIAGGQADNFTRVLNAHGNKIANDIWSFGDASFDSLACWCETSGVPLHRGRRLRLITSPHELKEATKASEMLASSGFQSRLTTPKSLEPFGQILESRVLAIQDDGERAGWLNVHSALSTLHKATQAAVSLPVVKSIESRSSGRLSLVLDQGLKVQSEIVVLANHLAIGDFLPQLREALVSVADQWTDLELLTPAPSGWNSPGIVFSLNHGLEWGVTCPNDRIAIGGARYLRPLAGFEAKVSSVENRVKDHLFLQFAKSFSFGSDARVKDTKSSLDCRPCDELPIVGPLFGDGRILVATGYMGQGLSQGFYAGRCLAELISTGFSATLPRMLWPERLRSLDQ